MIQRSLEATSQKLHQWAQKVVNGPLAFSVLAKPAAFTAATKVLKLPAETAVSTMSFGFL